MRRRVWQNRCFQVRKRDTEARLEEKERMKRGKCTQHIPPSKRADVFMIKKLRQTGCCLANISAVAETWLFDYNGRVDYVYWSATMETVLCYLLHANNSPVTDGWQWHARASEKTKTCVCLCDVLFNLSSFCECSCHLAAVIPFYYHGLACEQFQIIPIKLALIKIDSKKKANGFDVEGKACKKWGINFVWVIGK